MHIPDGFLSVRALGPCWVFSIAGISFAIKKTGEAIKDRMVPLMGVVAAFIFAAQMLNFPVAGGTSGHLLGGILAAVLVGPWAGAIIITVVLIIQCLVFQDGGLSALGANVFNMAIIGAMGGYCIYHVIRILIGGNRGILIGAAIAAWASVVIAASACAVELAFSGTSPLGAALPAMAGVHALIGIGEAAITYLVVGFVLKTRPDLIYNTEEN